MGWVSLLFVIGWFSVDYVVDGVLIRMYRNQYIDIYLREKYVAENFGTQRVDRTMFARFFGDKAS